MNAKITTANPIPATIIGGRYAGKSGYIICEIREQVTVLFPDGRAVVVPITDVNILHETTGENGEK